MRKPGSKTGMSPVCENRPPMVYARVCRGMQGHVQNDREIFVREENVARRCAAPTTAQARKSAPKRAPKTVMPVDRRRSARLAAV